MGPLQETRRGNKYIVVISDYFTKWTEAYAAPDKSSLTVAEILVEEFIFRYGIPLQLHSDQGPEFESNLIRDICRLLRIHKTRTTVYHPQSDGLVERANRTVKQQLGMMVNDARDNWDEMLAAMMFAYRSSVNATTKCTPNLLMLGREVGLPIDLLHPPENDNPRQCRVKYVEWVRNAAKYAYDCVAKSGMTNQDRYTRNFNLKSGVPGFKLGQSMW